MTILFVKKPFLFFYRLYTHQLVDS